MFGNFSKPLHLPKPRRRDRPAGRRSAHLRAVLSRPTGGQRSRQTGRQHPARPGPSRTARTLGALAAAVLLTGLVLVGGLGARAADAAAEVRPVAEAPADYAALVGLVADVCAGGPCALGARAPSDPPAEIRRLMGRLRVRSVAHDPTYAQTTLRGSVTATHHLVYDHPAPADVRALRERKAAFLATIDSARAARSDYLTHRPPEPLGGGWWRVPGR